mgnify:CR=1 FL=1
MTAPIQDQVTASPSNAEINFRKQEMAYERRLNEESRRREDVERQLKEVLSRQNQHDDEEDKSDEPYIDDKRLDKKLKKFGQQSKQETERDIQKAVNQAIAQTKQEAFLENNPDFFDYLENNVEKFANTHPSLARSLHAMPDNFERKVLVFETMKKLGVDKPVVKESSIQQKIDQNQRGNFYQPTNIGSPGYASSGGDFSATGQKNAYDKMQELKARLKIG